MFVIKIFIIFILNITIVFGGNICPGDMIIDIQSSQINNNYNTVLDCACPSGRGLDFNLSDGKRKFGICSTNNTYRLNIKNYPNLILWLDAADVNADDYYPDYLSNSNLYIVKDKSGNSNHASNSSYLVGGATLPVPLFTFSPSLNNGAGIRAFKMPSISFTTSGASSLFIDNMRYISYGDAITIFIVVQYLADNNIYAGAEYIFNCMLGTAGYSLSRRAASSSIPNTYYTDFNYYTSNGLVTLSNNYTPLPGYDASTTIQSSNLIVLTNNNKIMNYYINPDQNTPTVGAYPPYNYSPIMSGRQNGPPVTYSGNYSNSSSSFMLGKALNGRGTDSNINELIIFNRALSNGERREIEQYLRKKWSIF